ncbi:MAG: hypothetical protein M3O78_02595 [Chloroflexota bacterium]|nr:hypothetical protein [Chloroflexota bacterium]
MARRGGKAANRRDRQRRAKQRSVQRGPAQQRPIQGVVSEAIEAAAESRATKAQEQEQEQVERPAPARAASRRAGRADPRFTISGPSRLSAGAAAEYHYVLRDVRNIGVLVAVMAVLLVAAVLLFHALGLGTA